MSANTHTRACNSPPEERKGIEGRRRKEAREMWSSKKKGREGEKERKREKEGERERQTERERQRERAGDGREIEPQDRERKQKK